MRVLITGNLGYIGPVLVRKLRDRGHQTVGVDTGWFADINAGVVAVPDSQHLVDLRDLVDTTSASASRLRAVLDGVDAVCHLAGLSNDPLSSLDPILTNSINFDASARFAEAVKAAGIRRFVFYSSCSVYGNADGEINEDYPPAPLTPYARAKLQLEEHLQALADQAFSPILLRNATVYGYAPALRLDLLVNGMTAWALTTGVVRLISTGDALRPQVHIDDLTELTCHLLELADREYRTAASRPINVGSNDGNYSIRELAEIVASRVEGAEVRRDVDAWVDTRSYRVNFDLLKVLSHGYRVTRTVEGSISEMAGAYARLQLTSDDVRTGRFTRLQQLLHARRSGSLNDELRPFVEQVGPR